MVLCGNCYVEKVLKFDRVLLASTLQYKIPLLESWYDCYYDITESKAILSPRSAR